MDTRTGLLIIGAGLLALAFVNHHSAESDPFERQKAAARSQIRSMVRDPDSIGFHSLSAGSGDTLVVIEADFSARNGFGGMNRERWRLGFERSGGSLVMVRDEKTGRMLLNAQPQAAAVASVPSASPASLPPLPPSPLLQVPNQAIDVRIKSALDMVPDQSIIPSSGR